LKAAAVVLFVYYRRTLLCPTGYGLPREPAEEKIPLILMVLFKPLDSLTIRGPTRRPLLR
jgi:hypothetical protein